MPAIKTINFTIENLERLPRPEKGLAIYRDKQNAFLNLYITPTGAKTFFIRRRVKRQDQRIRVGSFPGLTITQARVQATLLVAEIEKGLDPLAEKRKASERQRTLEEQCALYIEQHCKKKNKRWQEREKDIANYLKPLLHVPFTDIRQEDVERLHMRIGRSAPVKANRIVSLLQAVYNHAIKKGYEGRNPTRGIDYFRESSRDRFVQPEEMPFLIAALEKEKSQMVRDFFWILLLTGARKMNVQQMRWQDIDWHFLQWRIEDSKNGEPLTLPLAEKALEILTRRKKEARGPFVFPQKGNSSKAYNNPQKAWNRIKARATLLLLKHDEKLSLLVEEIQRKESQPGGEQALLKKVLKRARDDLVELPQGLLDIRIHDLRRTFGSYQAITGASMQVIGKSLGHKSIQATQIYARLNLDPIRASIEKATAAMLANVPEVA